MKKIQLLFLLSLFLSACSNNGQSLNSTTTYRTNSEFSNNTVIISEFTSEATTDITPYYETVQKELNTVLQALIDKNESELWRIKYKSADDFLDHTDFTSYEIVSNSNWQRDDKAFISEFLIELNVLQSTDNRFPIGTSTWRIGFINENVWFFLPQEYDAPYLYENIKVNPYAELGFMFSYAFPFETINDIQDLPYIYDKKDFLNYLHTFILGISPELKVGADYGNGAYGEYNYNKERINEIISDYLGIENYIWDESFTGFSGICAETVTVSDFVIINELTDNYIDMTYFADYVYLKPAKKMRYYFTDNKETIQLTGTELLEDYGYEPNWELN